ncbi:MAG: hypothetical protein Q8N34_03430 [Gammaproteobacteria bacterium]|nr:hypothetical protein [Gammaproteobacteria bacterium]
MKSTDIADALPPDEVSQLRRLMVKVEQCRNGRGKKPLQCVVIESDWPEYEPVWQLLEQRVDGLAPDNQVGTVTDQFAEGSLSIPLKHRQGAVLYHGQHLYASNFASFQIRVDHWMMACFGEEIAGDVVERNHRFLEEALELVQACGCTQAEAQELVSYVYGRPVGEMSQEVGGVMVTLAALCNAQKLNFFDLSEEELSRVWTKIDAIREKQKSKPTFSPLPGVYPDRQRLCATCHENPVETGAAACARCMNKVYDV